MPLKRAFASALPRALTPASHSSVHARTRAWIAPPALHRGCVLEQGEALELVGEQSEGVADAAVKCKCGPLLVGDEDGNMPALAISRRRMGLEGSASASC